MSDAKGSASPSSVGHRPDGKWTFDEDVTNVFDDMLRRSIPDHDGMRRAVHEVACKYVQPKTSVLDLGCARGTALDRIRDKFGAQVVCVGVDVSAPMVAAARARYALAIENETMRIFEHDLRDRFPPTPAAPSVILSVLTLQFVPINYRQQILADAHAALAKGGALVLVEKVLGSDAASDALLVALYHEAKERAGYSREDIDRKKHSLEGVLVPVTARWNEELLSRAGFRSVECFWRALNFAAWVAVK